jgi:Two component regulator propeller
MRKISWHRRWEGVAGAARRALFLGGLMLLLLPQDAPAQQFTFRQYGQQDGLANLAVTCLLQDRTGFIWICTENGLFRHDGADFERFGESEGIENTVIHSAVEDSLGRLWVGTSHDLYLGDGHRFRPVRPEGRNLNIAPGLRIAALAPGRMLIIEEDQLVELRVSPKDDVCFARPHRFCISAASTSIEAGGFGSAAAPGFARSSMVTSIPGRRKPMCRKIPGVPFWWITRGGCGPAG